MKKIIITIIIFSIVLITGVIFFKKDNNDKKNDINIEKTSDLKSSTTLTNKNTQKFLDLPNLSSSKFSSQITSDIILGDKTAKITIIEYASLSCSHCASFHKNNFDLINQKLIKTGKAKFIYRDFPLNYPALFAAISASCLYQETQNNAQYYKYIKSLFATQDDWAFTKNFENKIKKIATLYGLKNNKLQKCLEDENLKEKIIQIRIDGSKEMQVKSTPTIFINGYMIKGAVDFSKIEEVINFISNQQ